MITQEFLSIVDTISNNLDKKYEDLELSERDMVLGKALKLSEEVGELQQIVLSKYFQRREGEFDMKDLEDEVADVILTSLLLGKAMGVDINTALKNKIQKISDRGGV